MAEFTIVRQNDVNVKLQGGPKNWHTFRTLYNFVKY